MSENLLDKSDKSEFNSSLGSIGNKALLREFKLVLSLLIDKYSRLGNFDISEVR